MLADAKVIYAVLILLAIVAVLAFRQRTPARKAAPDVAAGGAVEQFGPPGLTGNFHGLSAQLRGPCEAPIDYDQAAMSPLFRYRDALAAAGTMCGDTPTAAATTSGYTTEAWRPERVPTAGLAPVVGDKLGPALGPIIDLPSGEGYTGSSPALPSSMQAATMRGALPARWDMPVIPASCMSGMGEASEACYAARVPSWSQRPDAGDFYSPEHGSARPAHELPYADQGGQPYATGTVTPTYNMLFEPDHEPAVGATTSNWVS